MRTLYFILVSLRPKQWLKNLSVFAALFFGARLFNQGDTTKVFLVFLIFCLLSSSSYLVNDLFDAKADQAHFSKKNRPIASGKLTAKNTILVAFLLSFFGLSIALIISETIFLTAMGFIVVQLLYSLVLKKIIILDIMTIAFLFMIRVFAGSFVIRESLSSWLILTVMMLALFLAIGKRRSELTLLTHQKAVLHRLALSHYPINLLDGLTFMMATASLLTYSLFTFNTDRASSTNLLSNYLPQTLSNTRFLMLTIPLVIYGIFRYLYLIFEKKEGESPEKVLLTDLPLFTTVAFWILAIFILTYVFNV